MLTRKLPLSGCLILLICAPLFAQDYVIEPGRRVGKIEIGAPREAVRRTLGKPARTFPTHRKLVADSWSNSNTGNQLEVVYEAGKVIQVKVSSASFSTPEGISTSKSLAEIKRAYPRLKKTTYFYDNESGRGLDYYDDLRQGITFVFGSPNTDPPEEIKAYVIIVHRAGSRPVPVEIRDPSNKVE
jgi:hypothetical protein